MLQFKLFLISVTFAVLCQCSDPVNTADKETQIKQLEEVSTEFFVAVYRQDTAKLNDLFADEVIMKPHHFFFKNVMDRVAEESVIELKIDKKTHISNYVKCIGQENTPLNDQEILEYFNGIETGIILYEEECKIKEIVYYTPSIYTNDADMNAEKQKKGRIEFKLKKGDAIFRMAKKTLKDDGGYYFQFRYFPDGWKIVAEFQ